MAPSKYSITVSVGRTPATLGPQAPGPSLPLRSDYEEGQRPPHVAAPNLPFSAFSGHWILLQRSLTARHLLFPSLSVCTCVFRCGWSAYPTPGPVSRFAPGRQDSAVALPCGTVWIVAGTCEGYFYEQMVKGHLLAQGNSEEATLPPFTSSFPAFLSFFLLKFNLIF